MYFYYQQCDKCGDIKPPTFAHLNCNVCTTGTYQDYEEYKEPMPTLNQEKLQECMKLDWTEDQLNGISLMFSAAEQIMMQCEGTQSVREWNAMYDIREQLNHLLVAVTVKNMINENNKG